MANPYFVQWRIRDEVLKAVVHRFGKQNVAKMLGVSYETVCRWIRRGGNVNIHTYERAKARFGEEVCAKLFAENARTTVTAEEFKEIINSITVDSFKEELKKIDVVEKAD